MNQYQKQIARLVDEYKSLTKRQLLRIVNKELGTNIPNLDRYIVQMCHFADYTEIPYPGGTILTEKGCEPDFDMIYSVDVMLCFLDKIILHGRGQPPVSIRFFIDQELNMKEINIVPVKLGEERKISVISEDKFNKGTGGIIIFLLEKREQIKLMDTTNGRFAVIEKDNVFFFKK